MPVAPSANSMPVRVCLYPKDDKIPEFAVNGRADYIVTGDEDLLLMNSFRRIAIIRPAEFLAVVAALVAMGTFSGVPAPWHEVSH